MGEVHKIVASQCCEGRWRPLRLSLCSHGEVNEGTLGKGPAQGRPPSDRDRTTTHDGPSWFPLRSWLLVLDVPGAVPPCSLPSAPRLADGLLVKSLFLSRNQDLTATDRSCHIISAFNHPQKPFPASFAPLPEILSLNNQHMADTRGGTTLSSWGPGCQHGLGHAPSGARGEKAASRSRATHFGAPRG